MQEIRTRIAPNTDSFHSVNSLHKYALRVEEQELLNSFTLSQSNDFKDISYLRSYTLLCQVLSHPGIY